MTTRVSLSAILLAIFTIFFAASCATAPEIIPEDLSPAELIQRAQNAAEKKDYLNSVRLYQALLDRHPSNLTAVCAAEYEIAFIRYKQKNHKEAAERFKALLQRYEGEDAALLPTEFKVLSEKILTKIELEGE